MRLQILSFLLFSFSCSQELPQPKLPEITDPQTQEWDEIVLPIVERTCEPCHVDAKFIQDSATFMYSSEVLNRISSGSMPRPESEQDRQFSARDRRDLLWFTKGGY